MTYKQSHLRFEILIGISHRYSILVTQSSIYNFLKKKLKLLNLKLCILINKKKTLILMIYMNGVIIESIIKLK